MYANLRLKIYHVESNPKTNITTIETKNNNAFLATITNRHAYGKWSGENDFLRMFVGKNQITKSWAKRTISYLCTCQIIVATHVLFT